MGVLRLRFELWMVSRDSRRQQATTQPYLVSQAAQYRQRKRRTQSLRESNEQPVLAQRRIGVLLYWEIACVGDGRGAICGTSFLKLPDAMTDDAVTEYQLPETDG
jgi:hypothetical protein